MREQAVWQYGVPRCPKCHGTGLDVYFRELVRHSLDTSKGKEGWGDSEAIEADSPDPISSVECADGCRGDGGLALELALDDRLINFIRGIE